MSIISKINDIFQCKTAKKLNIPSYSNYFISKSGRIFSYKTKELKELSPRISNGYKRIELVNNMKIRKQFLLHILVYRTFANDYNSSMVINHMDLNKQNNNFDNLEMVTQSENAKHAVKRTKAKPLTIIDSNSIKEFDSAKLASLFLQRKRKITVSPKTINNWSAKENMNSYGFVCKYKRKSKKIQNIENYKSIGIIDNIDFSKYLINKNGELVNTLNNSNNVMTPRKQENGYVYYTLTVNGKQKNFYAHRLVAKVFLKDGETKFFDKGYVVNHKNEQKDNNTVDNLEWATYKENSRHSIAKPLVRKNSNSGLVMKRYNSFSEACDDIGKPVSCTSNISKACKTDGIAYGFKWMRI